jgi:4'-phosphopantetheinyl transferase EntD
VDDHDARKGIERGSTTNGMTSMEASRVVATPDEREVAQVFDQLSTLASSAHADLLVGCRAVQPGDEFALSPSETFHLGGAISVVRRRSGAARVVARALLHRLGSSSFDLPRTSNGAPRWPNGFVGSLSHDSELAVAAVAIQYPIESVGIDVEPSLPLPAELIETVATPAEMIQLGTDLLSGRLLFSIKEAVYKATNPIDGLFLDYHDVEVDLDKFTARTTTGHHLRFFAVRRPRILSLIVILR